MGDGFRPCENCQQKISLLCCCFPGSEHGFPYLCVCKVCVANIGLWVSKIKEMCDDDGEYIWTGTIVDGGDNLLWSEADGQLFDPDNDTRQF